MNRRLNDSTVRRSLISLLRYKNLLLEIEAHLAYGGGQNQKLHLPSLTRPNRHPTEKRALGCLLSGRSVTGRVC